MGTTLRPREKIDCVSRKGDNSRRSKGGEVGIVLRKEQEWSGVCVVWSSEVGVGQARTMDPSNREEHTSDSEELNVPKPRPGKKTKNQVQDKEKAKLGFQSTGAEKNALLAQKRYYEETSSNVQQKVEEMMDEVNKKRRITPKQSIENEMERWVVDTGFSRLQGTKVC